jgi:hypothetical protein
MKFDTKNAYPIPLRPSGANIPSRGLDCRDLAFRQPNPVLPSDSEESDYENDNDDCLGRRIEHLPRVFYTPVKVSARTNNSRKSTGGSATTTTTTTRTVTNREMEELNDCLANLNFSPNKENDKNQKDENDDNNEAGPLMGRIPKTTVNPKTGRSITVLRSARVSSNKISRS